MAPRANWKGYLKLSLVSCAVALFPATSTTQRTRFNIVNRKTGSRVRNQVVDAETGEAVPEEDRVKGYKVDDDAYVLLDDKEIDEVAIESNHTIEIESFVPRDEVDAVYLDAPYYLVPDDRIAQEAFAVIREAMHKQNVVGLGRVALYRRERALMIEPRGKGLLATSLRFTTEVRNESAYFDDIPAISVADEMLDFAVHIVKTKAAHFAPEKFDDRYEQALAKLIQAKRDGAAVSKAPSARPGNVINLMDALQRSIESERRAGDSARKPIKKNEGEAGSDRAGPPPRRRRANAGDASAKRKRLKKAS